MGQNVNKLPNYLGNMDMYIINYLLDNIFKIGIVNSNSLSAEVLFKV